MTGLERMLWNLCTLCAVRMKMILKNDVDVLDKIQELFSDCIRNQEFGEFSVTLTMNHGRPVRLQKTERENLVRYEHERIVVEK